MDLAMDLIREALLGGSGGGGGGLEHETGTWTPTEDVARGEVSFSNEHDIPPSIIVMADSSGHAPAPENAGISFAFINAHDWLGVKLPYTSSNGAEANAFMCSRATSSASASGLVSITNYGDGANNTYTGYYATNEKFYPYTNSASRYWKAGRNYKWIALWL